MEKKSGIYICKCLINNGIYIGQTGSTNGFYNRWRTEKWQLRHGIMHNIHWQRAWNKYREENFEFRIQEECSDDVIDQREMAWIKYYREAGYNVYNVGDGGIGRHPMSEKTKELLRLINTGKKDTMETRIKKSNALRGRFYSKETREKIGLASRNRKKDSEETRIKKGMSNRGKHPSKETREKNRLAHLGRVFTEEHIKNMSLANLGKHHSEETKIKMRIARQKYLALKQQGVSYEKRS